MLYQEFDYQFVVITSLSLDPWAQLARKDNLLNLFGPAIKDVICLDTDADKDEALEQYRDSGLFWLEDKPANARLGVELGLKSVMMIHNHNINDTDGIPYLADSWFDVARIVTAFD